MSSGKEPPRQIRTDDDEESEASRDDVRLFAFFLDDYHVRLENSMQARDQLARFVQTQLGPTDMIGLMYPLDPTAAVRMTRNHDAIMKALQQFRGRKYDYTPRNEFEERYAYYPTDTVEKVRNQVSLSAIKALIMRMGALKEGRKALILISEGYNAMLPPQMRDQNANIPGSGNTAAGDPFAGANNIMEDRAQFSAAWTWSRIFATSMTRRTRTTWPSMRSTRAACRPVNSASIRTSRSPSIATSSTRPWKRCARWPSTQTDVPSSTATI
jgi:hypothetical protein